jgi:hypothetical protein
MVYIGSNKTMYFGGTDLGGWLQNTTYIYDLNSNSWSVDNNTTAPDQRYYHRIAETSMDGSSYTVLFGGYTDSRNDETWTFGGGDYPLPVELSMLNVECRMNSVDLRWKTETEVNNYGFEVEKKLVSSTSLIVNHWLNLGFVAGAGNSNTPLNYSFTDSSLSPGRYAYRIKQIDLDGTFNYTDAVEVEVGVAKEFLLGQNYPNPFNPTTTISFTLAEDGLTTLKVFDILGREVAVLVNEELKAGTLHKVTFNASQLASGMYFYTLSAGDYSNLKKFILIK